MFAWWGSVVYRLRWLVLVATLGFAVFAGVWGTGVFDRLADGASLNDPDSESQQTGARITEEVGAQNVDLIVLYSSDELTVDDPEFRDAVVDATARIRAHPTVEDVVASYYETSSSDLVSADEHATYLPLRLADAGDEAIEDVRDSVDADGLTTQVGGQEVIDVDIDGRVGDDIVRAELIAMPILLVLLLFIFGGLVAASTPLLIGALGVLGAFTVTRLLTMVTDVSVFSINVITIFGLGLAIDYSLFLVNRFREELDRGQPVSDAVSRTVATAGRTVAVSGVIVMLSLSGLLIFPQLFLRSMGLGGGAAVLVAMVLSLTLLPALLGVLGHRIDKVRLPWARRRRIPTMTGAVATAAVSAADHGAWARVASSVMRRPVLYAVGVTALLLVLAAPFTRVQFGGIDERVLPEGTESRVVSERLGTEFTGNSVDPIAVLVSGAAPAAAADFTDQVAAVSGVRDAAVTAQEGESTVLTVNYDGAANGTQARGIVEDIRALEQPDGAEVMVGGETATVVDQLAALADRLPWMVLLVAGITFALLTLAFGSVVVPLKAIVMNVVSIGAAFGVVTWIFQDGNLAGWLDFTPTGYLEASQPILMLAVLFGLSMDYEVFLLSRIREQWDNLGDNTLAVASGVQRTGGIITAAALLLCVVIGSFATSGITFIKMIGVGMLVALLLDATLVRLLLVPATMRLLGRHNWWAPRFVHRLYRRYGFHESGSVGPAGRQAPELRGTR